MKIERSIFAKCWIALACSALLLSGLLALVITFAKMPMIKDMVQDINLIRWCLVIHVNLATLVWFTALPLGLVHLVISKNDDEDQISHSQFFGFILAIVGILLMITAFPSPRVDVIMSNYIPVVTHPKFYWGIAFYVVGVLLNYLSLEILLPKDRPPFKSYLGLIESRFGLWVGTVYFLFAIVVFGFSLHELLGLKIPYNTSFFESLMWGSGHLLQHSSISFLLVTWILLLSGYAKKSFFTRSELSKVFCWMGIPILFLPILLWYSVLSPQFRMGFTYLMQFGIAPPVLYFGFLTFKKLKKSKVSLTLDYKIVALFMSVALMLIGFIFGAFIRGTDMRVPGHYHAAIGAITIGFMALSYHLLSEKLASEKWIQRSMWTYGFGQIFFSSGMFIAGSYGMGRKTYGSEHIIKSAGQYLGFGTMAIGGLIAFLGGLFFAMAILPKLNSKIFLNSKVDIQIT